MSAEVRQRSAGSKGEKVNGSNGQAAGGGVKSKKSGVSVVDVLRILGGLFLLNCALSYFVTNDSVLWGYRPWFARPAVLMRYMKGPINLTDAELRTYDGTDPAKPIYVALNGTIYDVTAGRRVYGPDGSYHVFAGKDATRAFITGCFEEDSTPDLRGAEWAYVQADCPYWDVEVSPAQKTVREQLVRNAKKQVEQTIEGWRKMFSGEGGKDYFPVGKMKRPEGWLEALPKRKLCAQAEKSRPKPQRAA